MLEITDPFWKLTELIFSQGQLFEGRKVLNGLRELCEFV